MTSKTAPASVAPAPAPEYATIRRDGWTHEWNIKKNANEKESRRAIDDYYAREERVFSVDQAYPHHHALIQSAHRSASKLLLVAASPAPECCATATETFFAGSKHHITALSGMTGMLVRRILGLGLGGARRCRHINGLPLAPFPFGDLHETTKKTHAKLMNQYIHSALAAEYIIGNRYFRNVVIARKAVLNLAVSSAYSEFPVLAADAAPEVREEQRRRYEQDRECPVGMLRCSATKNLTARDITPEALEITRQELLEAYSANIDRLMAAIRQYRRGFVSLADIRTDPEFVRLNTAFWRYSHQVMKAKSEFEERDATAASNLPFHAVHPADYSTFRDIKDAKRFIAFSLISEPAVLVPRMYKYEVARIFDNWRQSYVKYIKTTKESWARLANDGSNTTFLAFAAIEPEMVTTEYAPTIGCTTAYHTLALKSCANYIPSRHPVFGALCLKHRHHIPRTADVMNAMHENHAANYKRPNVGIPRSFSDDRNKPTYDSFGELVDDIRRPETLLTFGVKYKTVARPNSGSK
jgi:hypothetical protein